MIYYRNYKVPVWIMLLPMSGDRVGKLTEWLKTDKEAMVVPWPANSFPETLRSMANKGWAHAVPPKDKSTILDTQLMMAAAVEHIHKHCGPSAYLTGQTNIPNHRLDRTINGDEDLVRLFNDLLAIEEPVVMSKMFSVAENCHMDGDKVRVYVTPESCPKSLLTRIADHVITVGDGASCDINAKGVKLADLKETIETQVGKLLGLIK